MNPIRVQRSRRKGAQLPANTKCVTRPGPFGNPYKVGNPGIRTNADAVIAFKNWIWRTPEGEAMARKAKRELRGFNLACFCPLDKPCHADELLRIANE